MTTEQHRELHIACIKEGNFVKYEKSNFTINSEGLKVWRDSIPIKDDEEIDLDKYNYSPFCPHRAIYVAMNHKGEIFEASANQEYLKEKYKLCGLMMIASFTRGAKVDAVD